MLVFYFYIKTYNVLEALKKNRFFEVLKAYTIH